MAARSGSRSTGTSVRIVWPTASSRSGSWNSRLPPVVTLVAQRDEDLLLARLAGEVALAERLARPGVGERVHAVEVMRPGGDREPRHAAGPVAVVLRVVEVPRHVDVHAADGVDHLDEAARSRARVVVDRDPEQRPDASCSVRIPPLREVLRVAVRVGHQAVELGAVTFAVAERRVDEVARDRDERDRVADRVERGDHHRVGQVASAAGLASRSPMSRTLIRSPVARRERVAPSRSSTAPRTSLVKIRSNVSPSTVP